MEVEYLEQATGNWRAVSNPVHTPSTCSPNDVNIISFTAISTQKVRVIFTRDVANDYYVGLTEIEIWAQWPPVETINQNTYEAEDGLVVGSKVTIHSEVT